MRAPIPYRPPRALGLAGWRRWTRPPWPRGGRGDGQVGRSGGSAGVDLVVFCRRIDDARVVTEILAVGDPSSDGIEATTGLIFEGCGTGLVWTGEVPRRVERFGESGIDLREILR